MMSRKDNFKIATWNVCLGIANKKDIVTETLSREGISICCLQETEIPMNFPEEILNCNNYNLELEMNNTKKRVGIYVAKGVNYKRRKDLEREDLHIVIIDILGNRPTRIINVYRTFRPLDVTPAVFFDSQIQAIGHALTSNCYILGAIIIRSDSTNRKDRSPCCMKQLVLLLVFSLLFINLNMQRTK